MESIRDRLGRVWQQIRLLAQISRGLFKPSLARITRQLVKKQLQHNAAARDHRYPILKRLVRWSEGHPAQSLAIAAGAYASVFLLAHFDLLPAAPDPASTAFVDFIPISGAILGAQATLIGLVFPLVIAFVGLLNQSRASFASRLTIYIESSVAVFAGVSSLLLCVAIAAQLLFVAPMPRPAGIAVTGINLLWFVINVTTLAYFVLRTIVFLHPAKRLPITRAYVANVVWPRELSEVVLYNRWGNATAYGYLPSGDDSDMFGGGAGRARVWYGLWDSGEPRVTRYFTHRKRLVNIRLGMLAAVVHDWLTEARAQCAAVGKELGHPVQPGRGYVGVAVV